jgi:hypothetical protein
MILFKQVKPRSRPELHASPTTDAAVRFSTLKTFLCLQAVKLLHDQGTIPLRFRR